MEQRLDALLKAKVPFAFGHFGAGAGAIGVGAMAALRKSDVMIGAHRGFCEYIGKGMKPADLWAEYLGRKGLLDGQAAIQVSDQELHST
jgi:TPP-dependent pyruvate/acetoin dehydrogenase alpha subunit